MCIFKNKHMKLIIKNDNRDIVKNPNVKIIETTEASFTNQTVFIEENDVPIIKYTDTEAMYFVKDLDNLYDRKSRSEVLLDITINNLETIGSGSSGDFVPLAGTIEGNPIIGKLNFQNFTGLEWTDDSGFRNLLSFEDYVLQLFKFDNLGNVISSISLNGVKGITSETDFSNIITDLDYTQKKYVDERGSVFNATTSVLSASDLNTAYPNAKDGFSVIAPNVVGGGKYYIKAGAGWVYQQILTVV